jgi:hypothetical protein
MIWNTKSRVPLPINSLSDQHLVNILRMLQRDAEEKRTRALDTIGSYSPVAPIVDRLLNQTWRDYVVLEFKLLEEEAEKRNLKWDLSDGKPINEIVNLSEQRGTLERKIVGAIRNAIDAHGPITYENANSAGKRVIGAIKDHNRRFRR